MDRNQLPFAVQKDGEIRITVEPWGSGYVVSSLVYQEYDASSWSDMLDCLREQRNALAATGLPVIATYHPNGCALAARNIEIPEVA
jgi:hypothetical protein